MPSSPENPGKMPTEILDASVTAPEGEGDKSMGQNHDDSTWFGSGDPREIVNLQPPCESSPSGSQGGNIQCDAPGSAG